MATQKLSTQKVIGILKRVGLSCYDSQSWSQSNYFRVQKSWALGGEGCTVDFTGNSKNSMARAFLKTYIHQALVLLDIKKLLHREGLGAEIVASKSWGTEQAVPGEMVYLLVWAGEMPERLVREYRIVTSAALTAWAFQARYKEVCQQIEMLRKQKEGALEAAIQQVRQNFDPKITELETALREVEAAMPPSTDTPALDIKAQVE